MIRHRWIAGGLAASVLHLSVVAFAQAPEQGEGAAPAEAETTEQTQPAQAVQEPSEEAKREAKQRFDRGIDLYQDGDYALALIEFERTYELVPDYRVLYNIGQVSIQLGRYARAMRALLQYLKEGGDKIGEDRLSAVQRDLEMLKGRTAYLNVTSNIEGAEVVLDDVPVGEAPLAEPLLVDAGEHRLTVRKQGYVVRSRQVALAGGEDATINVELVAEPKQQGSRTVIVDQRTTPRVDDTERTTLLWIGWSTTAALAIGTGIFAALGIEAHNDYKSKLDAGEFSSPDERDSDRSRARMLITAADVAGAATLVAGGLSLWLTLSGPDEPKQEKPLQKSPPPKPNVSARVGPGMVTVVGTF